MGIMVQKYGGTSVQDVNRINKVADRIIATSEQGYEVVAVVSAMGKTTDELVNLAKQINPQPPAREMDALLSTGEKISAALLAMAIEAKGYSSLSLTGGQAGILTEPVYSKAKIQDIDPTRIKKELSSGKIVIITGFQGINEDDDIITIGRGGSDTSAVAIAAALDADFCEIYTDVDGVFVADPRMVKNARKLEEISYEEMLELASLGAGVLHPRAVETAQFNNIVLHVRSSFNDKKGTIVKEGKNMERKKIVTGIAHDKDVAKITVLRVPDIPGSAAEIFSGLGKANVNVDMIIQSSHQEKSTNDITFTVSRQDLQCTLEVTKKIANEIKAGEVIFDDKVGKISIVGVGMISTPGVASKLFTVLGKENINIDLISTSEIKISCVIPESDLLKAANLIHESFDLGAV